LHCFWLASSLLLDNSEVQPMGLLLAILILLLVFSVPAWPYSAGWGYYPSGGLGLVLLILLILMLVRRPV
jgi:hypothetical protein